MNTKEHPPQVNPVSLKRPTLRLSSLLLVRLFRRLFELLLQLLDLQSLLLRQGTLNQKELYLRCCMIEKEPGSEEHDDAQRASRVKVKPVVDEEPRTPKRPSSKAVGYWVRREKEGRSCYC